MSHNMVHRNGGWEGNTPLKILGLLSVQDFLHSFFNESINFFAECGDICSWNSEFFGLGECS